MIQRQTIFPLIPDEEPIIVQTPQMNLYEESDLISNIRGSYYEKTFEEDVLDIRESVPETRTSVFEKEVSTYSRKNRVATVTTPKAAGKTQGQLAREQARQDLKNKRSAAYLRDEKSLLTKGGSRTTPSTTEVLSRKQESSLSRLADKLRQDTYIIADLPQVYSLEKEEREKETPSSKNSYDFLRNSQVYNYPENKVRREQQLAQELNLTYIEED